jgi:hypothetical protein
MIEVDNVVLGLSSGVSEAYLKEVGSMELTTAHGNKKFRTN